MTAWNDTIKGLKPLDDASYLTNHLAFRKASNQQSLMLDWFRQHEQELIKDKHDLSVLSVGSGTGILDYPLAEMLVKDVDHVNYWGLDPNTEECKLFEKNMSKISSANLDVHVEAGKLEDFHTTTRYHLIHFIHVMYYFQDAWQSVKAALDNLEANGKIIIFVAPDNQLSSFFKTSITQLFGHVPCLSPDLENILQQHQVSYEKERITATLDVTDCFNGSDIGDQLLSFIVHADISNVPATQVDALHETLKSITSDKDGRFVINHEVDVFQIQGNTYTT